MMFYKAVIYLAAITFCTLRANTNPVFVLSTAFAATLLILGIAAAGVINSASAQQQKFTIKLSGPTFEDFINKQVIAYVEREK